MACDAGDVEMVLQLLDAGADADISDSIGSAPLHIAVKMAFGVICQELIKSRADLDAKDFLKMTPLHYASISDEVDEINKIVDMLISGHYNREDITGPNQSNKRFVILDSHRRTRWMQREGQKANMDLLDQCHKTPIYSAAEKNKFSVVKTLLEAGASFHSYDMDTDMKNTEESSIGDAVMVGGDSIDARQQQSLCKVSPAPLMAARTPLKAAWMWRSSFIEYYLAFIKGLDPDRQIKELSRTIVVAEDSQSKSSSSDHSVKNKKCSLCKEKRCPECREQNKITEINVMINFCKHVFHECCLMKHAERYTTCPTCHRRP
jgi:hypothetical protein